MPLHLALLTLLLHAAPSIPSPYAATHFEKETSTPKSLSTRYVQRAGQDAKNPEWVPRADFVPLQKQIREGKIAAPLPDADKALLQELDALARSKSAPKGHWYAPPAESNTPPPENLSAPSYLDPLLRLGQTKLTPASEGNPTGMKPQKRRTRQILSNMLLLEGSATDVKKVYFKYTLIHSARTLSKETTHGIALFEGGKLQRLVSLETSGFGLQEDDEEILSDAVRVNVMVPGYSEGKVSSLELTRLVDEDGDAEGDPPAGISLETTKFQSLTRS